MTPSANEMYSTDHMTAVESPSVLWWWLNTAEWACCILHSCTTTCGHLQYWHYLFTDCPCLLYLHRCGCHLSDSRLIVMAIALHDAQHWTCFSLFHVFCLAYHIWEFLHQFWHFDNPFKCSCFVVHLLCICKAIFPFYQTIMCRNWAGMHQSFTGK